MSTVIEKWDEILGIVKKEHDHSGNFAYGNLQRQFVILINVA